MSTPSVVFVTLLLNLCVGPQPVELAVTGPVTRVELHLDDRVVATLDGPPWRTVVDFGSLAPHRLRAVAFDAAGTVLTEAGRAVNLPAARAECSLLARDLARGVPGAVEILCRSYLGEEPSSLELTLDGEPWPVDDPGHVELPDLDPELPHFLSLAASFPEGVSATAQLGFGGGYGGDTSSELTAVPVVFHSRRAPELDELSGSFAIDGIARRVVAVEQPPAELLVVEDREARDTLISRMWAGTGPGSGRFEDRRATSEYNRALGRALQRDVDGHRVRFVDPFSVAREARTADIELFPVSPPFPLFASDLAKLLYNIGRADDDGRLLRFTEAALGRGEPMFERAEQRISDALAVAGLHAAAIQAPRAVLLIVGEAPEDGSVMAAADVLAYLERLQVPLVVWTTGGRRARDTPWGEATSIRNLRLLEWESERLVRGLDRHGIVWLEGGHPGGEVSLSGPSELELAVSGAVRGGRNGGRPSPLNESLRRRHSPSVS